MRRIAAAILAGGRGERLGGANKALLDIGGQRMIDRVVAAIGTVDIIVLSAGSNVFADDLPIPRERRIPDLAADYAGPLAGVAAAVHWLAANDMPDILLTVAVDTPFFPADFLARATTLLGEAEMVVATYREQPYPTNALWRFEALASLPRNVLSGTAPRSLKRVISSVNAVTLDYADLASDDPFANANTAAELERLRARAKP
jgi:molybdopterin-guanine dinucleotide biosynthesis protein A